VALFAERHFLSLLKSCKFYKEGRYRDALIDAFRRVDEAVESKGGEE
jgi:serine/threonine protein phosphatase PrpC